MPSQESFDDFLKNNENLRLFYDKINDHLVKENLTVKDYKNLLVDLRKLGLLFDKKIKITKPQKVTSLQDEEAFNKTLQEAFSVKIVDEVKKSKGEENSKTNESEKLINLRRFLTAWDQPNLQRGEKEDDRKRKNIKDKRDLDKADRRHVLIGLEIITFSSTEDDTPFVNLNTQGTLILKEPLDLINSISNQITLTASPLGTTEEEEKKAKEKEEKEINKIRQAILSFKTPTKTKKFVKYTGILMAFIGSLACGLSTGGAIFLLFPSLPILGFSVGALIALFSFSANFGFFSQNFPDFLLNLLKKGTITRYRRLPALKKYVLIPMAVIASITVGLGSAAITYTTVLALATQLLPMLALVWPPLTLVIVGILSLAVGVTLTVAVLTATVKGIKNSSPSFLWNNIKQEIGKLSKSKVVRYVFKAVLTLVGLFGLAYFRYTAGLDLIPFIGTIGSIITGVIAFIPQAVFTVFSIDKLIRVLTHRKEATENNSEDRFERFKSKSYSIYALICLVGNAIGNAALVVVDSISAWSISGAMGCFLNSWAGNTLEPSNNNQDHQKKLVDLLLQKYTPITPSGNAGTSQSRDRIFSDQSFPQDSNETKPSGSQSEPTTPTASESFPQESNKVKLFDSQSGSTASIASVSLTNNQTKDQAKSNGHSYQFFNASPKNDSGLNPTNNITNHSQDSKALGL